MKEANPDDKPSGRMRDGDISGRSMAIAFLVAAIPKDGRVIVDKTNLADKKFNFDLTWAPATSRAETESGPSLFTALEEQLGLKLVRSKTFGKVLVIDHIEKPTPN